MKTSRFISNIALVGCLALGATSCEDWLTLYPQDKIVEQQFWEDKNDLEGVRYAAYQNMAGTLEKFIIWGDIRSDNYEISPGYTGTNTGTRDTYRKIINALLDSTMTQYDWGGVYTTINYCNKVLSHGEEVLARDAQFTTMEWHEMRAEVTALRALNYFYLLRAFKDIPFSTRVINSDEEVMDFEQVNQLQVLDTLIHDVRAVQGQGRNRFSSMADTRGLMTNTAIYALLADMYLWRSALRQGRGFNNTLVLQDCDSVIYYGQLSLDKLADQNQLNQRSSYGTTFSASKNYEAGIPNSNLISNERVRSAYDNSTSIEVPSYTAIFDNFLSTESIFELVYSLSDNRKNGTIGSFWGFSSTGNFFIANARAFDKIHTAATKKEDTRMWYTCPDNLGTTIWTSSMLKWNHCLFSNDLSAVKVTTVPTNYDYNNWIFYRQTDVMLMMAEAYAVKGDFTKCRSIVDAIHKRATVKETTVSVDGTHNTQQACLKLVMNERQLELAGEGKRWFDLVRYAERIGGGTKPDPREPQYMDGEQGMRDMMDDFLKSAYSQESVARTVANRMKNRYGLYSPVFYMELRANHYKTKQNPVWNRVKGEDNEASETENL